jgi:hypothetical protein
MLGAMIAADAEFEAVIIVSRVSRRTGPDATGSRANRASAAPPASESVSPVPMLLPWKSDGRRWSLRWTYPFRRHPSRVS